jgi:diacylglycerol kinase (ATP)
MPASLALIAHDTKKADIVTLAQKYQATLARYHLIATGTTGQRVQEGTELAVECLRSGPDGGDTQIAARVVEGEVAAVVFLIDPRYAQPHEPDIRALLRVCELHNVPLATNVATAEMVLLNLTQSRTAYLIFNPVSGRGNPDRDLLAIRQILEPQILVRAIFTTPDVDPAVQTQAAIAEIQAHAAEKNAPDLIIASGGDGTVSAVAGAIVGTGIPLGIVPRGTANAFSVALGLPTTLKGACETILAGHTRIVDAARCNDLPMILLAGIGFEAGMVDRADRELKNRLGTLAYLMAGVQQLAAQQPFEAEVEIEKTISRFQCSAISVANAAPATSVLAQGFGQVLFDDGLLDVTLHLSQTGNQGILASLQSVTSLTTMFASALVKRPTDRNDIICLRTRHLKVTANPPEKIVVDGEIVGTTPAEFECLPKSLTIFSPIASASQAGSQASSENNDLPNSEE